MGKHRGTVLGEVLGKQDCPELAALGRISAERASTHDNTIFAHARNVANRIVA